MTTPLIVGWKESISLPDLGIEGLPAKVDTGARTASLHVTNAKLIEDESGERIIRFQADLVGQGLKTYEAPAAETRTVRSSNGEAEERLTIRTRLQLGSMSRKVDITLSDRTEMRFPMLVGRTSMRRGVLVDPLNSFLVSARIEPSGEEPEDADIADSEIGDD